MYDAKKIQKALDKLEAKANLLNQEKYYHKWVKLYDFCIERNIKVRLI